MKVLSCFDGISCGQVALERIGVKPTVYFASEIDKHAIIVTKNNYPNTVQLGDVKNVVHMVQTGLLSGIDLLIGGSPCQGFSNAGKQKGFIDPRSQLFFDFVLIKNKLKPKWFLLENVKMKKADEDIISMWLGVEPVQINSSLLSGQSRKRLYWTNIPIAPIVDKNIDVRLLIENCQIPNSENWHKWFTINGEKQLKKLFSRIINYHEKGICQVARQIRNWNGNLVKLNDNKFRFITPVEAERLQTLPDNYTSSIPKMKRYETIGNGWTVDVIAHILKGML